MHRHFLPTTRSGLAFVVLLTIGAGLVYGFAGSLGEPKRWIVVLLAVGFFSAPSSASSLNIHAWLATAAVVAWAGRHVAVHELGPVPLWATFFLAASLAVRGGERAADYYLPEANGDKGSAWRDRSRRELLVAVFLFLAVFVADGFRRSGLWEYSLHVRFARLLFLFSSAAISVRHLFQYSLDRGRGAESHLDWTTKRFVPAQLWPFLIFVALVGWSPLPRRFLTWLGEGSNRSLHLTAGLLMLLATAIFLAALVRLQRSRSWSRRWTRWASFLAGIFLAHTIIAFLVDLGYRVDPLGGGFFTARAAEGIKSVHIFIATFFLIVLPFVHERTPLVGRNPALAYLVAPPVLSIMYAPLAAINGDRWHLPSTVFLFFVTLIIVGYYLLVAFRENKGGKLFVTATFALLVTGACLDAAGVDPAKSVTKLFVMSLGFVLYSLDLYDRAGDFKRSVPDA